MTGLVVFAVLVLGAIAARLAAELRHGEARQDAPARPAPTARRGTGRSVLRAVRTVNDGRALARGPGALGRRLVRRSVFRALRRW